MRTLKFNSHSSKLMYAHLRLTLDSSRATAIMTEIHKWMDANGPEWTVDRLKSLKTWFLQHLAGNTNYSEPWFEKSQVNGSYIPKGTFGTLFKDAMHSKHRHDKKTVKILSALMVYTGIRLDKPSTKQIIKTVGSIFGTPLEESTVRTMRAVGKSLKTRLPRSALDKVARYKAAKAKGFNFKPVSLNTGKPFTSGGERYLRSFIQGLHVPPVRAYFEENFENFPKVESWPMPDPTELPPSPENILRQPLAGQIVVIQEPGAKARVIANPSAAAQVALYPLHQLLDSILRDLPTDCTHNQESGADWAFNQLASGKSVHSVDLSGATDNFPISLQLSLLTSLGLKSEAELIRLMANGIWMLHPDLHTDLINGGHMIAATYTRGQPQGLYSSFPLFGLTHNLLCKALAVKHGLSPDDSFRILGDDIVINNDKLHEAYREFMKKAGVPISEQKSLSSDQVAEFAGFIITKNGYYKPAKVPKSSNRPFEVNFMNYLRVVGTEGIKYLPARVRKIARKVAMLPEFYGGLGLNPEGLSFEARTDGFLEKLDDISEVPKYFSMRGSFTAAALSGDVPAYAEAALDWLHDQWNLYENHVQRLVSQEPTLARLVSANVAEPHSLAYQLSTLLESGADGRVLVGNKAPNEQSSGKPFKSDFQIWASRFEDLNETVIYPKSHSDMDSDPSGSKKSIKTGLQP